MIKQRNKVGFPSGRSLQNHKICLLGPCQSMTALPPGRHGEFMELHVALKLSSCYVDGFSGRTTGHPWGFPDNHIVLGCKIVFICMCCVLLYRMQNSEISSFWWTSTRRVNKHSTGDGIQSPKYLYLMPLQISSDSSDFSMGWLDQDDLQQLKARLDTLGNLK